MSKLIFNLVLYPNKVIFIMHILDLLKREINYTQHRIYLKYSIVRARITMACNIILNDINFVLCILDQLLLDNIEISPTKSTIIVRLVKRNTKSIRVT